MIYQVAICDDDKQYVEFVRTILTEFYPEELVYNCYYSGEDLLKADVHIKHPLIILDIQIGSLNGTEIAKKIRTYNQKAVLVFCSGVHNPTPETFVMTPYRFIQKQNSIEETKRYLRDVVEKMMTECQISLEVMCEGEISLVNLGDVIYIDKSKAHRIVHLHPEASRILGTGPFTTDLSFEELMERYEKYGLAYPHNSYLINLRYVKHHSKTIVTLKDGTELNVARSKSKEFLKKLSRYWGGKY